MATAKVIIAGQNNIGPAVKSAQGDISSLSNAAQKAGDVLKKAFTVTAIVAAIKKLGDACVSCFNDFWEALSPVLKVFAKVFVTVTGTIQYVIQTLQHWVATLMNWLAGLDLFGWQPFAGLRMNDPGNPGSYSSYIKGKWSDIDAAFDQTSTGTTSTATAVSSAGYQGATHVTINIYQEAPVVGDGGMRQFARMIRSEWENLEYYGVTT